jgi:hypothetical protein
MKHVFLLFLSIDSIIDLGRATYAEMLYRTNLIAYVPADHVTGLSSNVGKREQGVLIDMELF